MKEVEKPKELFSRIILPNTSEEPVTNDWNLFSDSDKPAVKGKGK